MIVVGVDPGAKWTGISVVGLGDLYPYLLASTTITRPQDGRELLDVPRSYLLDVNAAILAGVRDHDAQRIAVETVKRPAWRVKGKVKPLDPTAIMATALVLGSILGRSWPVELVRIPPRANGRLLPLNRYPKPLATDGVGQDKRRHERSAFDVALSARHGRILNR
jgi:hypothetical protein